MVAKQTVRVPLRDRVGGLLHQARHLAHNVVANTSDAANVLAGDLLRYRMPLKHEDDYHGHREPDLLDRLREHAPTLYRSLVVLPTVRDAAAVRNPRVLARLARSASEGLIFQRGRAEEATVLSVTHEVRFDWPMKPGEDWLIEAYHTAKKKQWDAASGMGWDGKRAYDWATRVDPANPRARVIPERLVPPASSKYWRKLTPKQRDEQYRAYASWIISQILHGEQGALMIAGQMTQSLPGRDAKLMAATQVMDEARHVEVFERYLREKLERIFPPNDNLYTVLATNVRQPTWDLQSLPMQIMIEGLAMSIFGLLRDSTDDPLLGGLLQYVSTDEARHVKFGVHLLEEHYANLSAVERRDQEDFAFELALLLRNRFLAHEIYEEYFAPVMTRREWEEMVLNSPLMREYRLRLFRGIMPNLRRIGLLSERIQPHYEKLGVLELAKGKSALEMSIREMGGVG